MLVAADLHGVMAMMPAFTADNGGDIRATATIDGDRLATGVDKMIRDGANAIAAAGSFGECFNLLPNEFEELVRATVETVKKRVPVIVGCVSPSSRETAWKVRVARDGGADGVMLGVPYYLPSTVDNAIQFIHDVADLVPDMGVLIYHNPPIHRITIPVEAFRKITEKPNVVGMKDSHRTTLEFMKLMRIVRGKMSVFAGQGQYYPYANYGAAGCWSIDSWMGPWPVLALRDAINKGDEATAQEITLDISSTREMSNDFTWREASHKIAIKHAGYCDPGPMRTPFVHVPEAIVAREHKRAERWQRICEKYRPMIERAGR
jgi:trans-o-hydroxybenzylidenepyruvate hydratase-aldolase